MICFNFDHTLTSRNTLLHLLLDTGGVQQLLLNLLKETPGLLMTAIGLKSKSKMKEQLMERFYWSWSEEKFNSLCEYSAQRNKHLLRPEIEQRMADALAEGEQVVVIASACEHLIRAYLKEYPQITIIGTRLDIFNGVMSGRFKGAECKGMEKVRRLLELFPDRKSYHLAVYGNQKEDVELLDFADEGHWVKA